MNRLRLFMLIFSLALAVPIGYLVVRTEAGLARQEEAEFRFFAEALFDRMEEELADFVAVEEARDIDDYAALKDGRPSPLAAVPPEAWIVGWLQNDPDGTMRAPLFAPGRPVSDELAAVLQRLAAVNRAFNRKRTIAPEPAPQDVRQETPPAPAILAEEKAAPSPSTQATQAIPESEPGAVAEGPPGQAPEPMHQAQADEVLKTLPKAVLETAPLRAKEDDKALGELLVEPLPEPLTDEELRLQLALEQELALRLDQEAVKKEGPVFAERYLDETVSPKKKQTLGQSKVRVEQVPQSQAQNIAPQAPAPAPEPESSGRPEADQQAGVQQAEGQGTGTTQDETPPPPLVQENLDAQGEALVVDRDEDPASDSIADAVSGSVSGSVSVEVAPLQAVAIDPTTVFLFRRVVIDGQVFRQGVALDLPAFARHLVGSHFAAQPMAEFARLSLSVAGDQGLASGGADVADPRLTLSRTFPRPFDFLTATLSCADIPPAPGRSTLRAMTGTLAVVMLLGLLAIHQSARIVVDHSRRRTQFVSSVTHELKTPLTNLRMYIEMLEQGMAPSPEREREYLEVLSSESSRLSKLIENVLEFSRLESRRRTLELQAGDLAEVVADVRRAMANQLDEAGFDLAVEHEPEVRAVYDREAMIQVLMNLMENSLKFGAAGPEKRIRLGVRTVGDRVLVSVSDTGPGIPPGEVKKVFDDFYRVEAGLTRTTKGTGIGLALVKRFVKAMNGRVWAENNAGPGCTMTIALPRA